MTNTLNPGLHNYDPTLLTPLTVPYETEHGTAYHAINPRTSEVITPLEGIRVEIHDQWAAEEVSAQLESLDNLLFGESDMQMDEEGVKPLTLEESLNNLSNLSVLHLDQSRVEAIENRVRTHQDGGLRWEDGKVADAIAEQQLEILSNMMPGSDALSHNTQLSLPILLSGALRPKAGHDMYRTVTGYVAGIKEAGEKGIQEHIKSMVDSRDRRRQEGVDPEARFRGHHGTYGLHSLLVHFSERLDRSYGLNNIVFPRASVIDRTPIVINGQDTSGVAGVRNGRDEANHDLYGGEAKRDRFAKVHVNLSPEVQSHLSARPSSGDITFMASSSDAAEAVDFEYPLEEGVLFLNPASAQELAEYVGMHDATDTVIPESVRKICAHLFDDSASGAKEGTFSIQRFSELAVRVQKEVNGGDDKHQYASPRSEAFWKQVISEMNTLTEQVAPEGEEFYRDERELIAETVLLRRALISMGYSPEWSNSNVFMSKRQHEEDRYSSYARDSAQAYMERRGGGMSYIQARAETLEFDQLDLMTQLPI